MIDPNTIASMSQEEVEGLGALLAATDPRFATMVADLQAIRAAKDNGDSATARATAEKYREIATGAGYGPIFEEMVSSL